MSYVSTWKPDFVAFQVITGDQDRWGAVAKAVKNKYPHIKTIFGGPHYLFFSKVKQEEADYIIRGDGEESILKIIEGDKYVDFLPIENSDSRMHPDRALLYNNEFPGVRDNVIRNFISTFGCLGYNTPILLASGIEIPIQEIQIGDAVLSYDVESGKLIKREVQNTYSRVADDLYELEMHNGTKINITGEHPAWTPTGWKKIEKFKEGELILATSTKNKIDLQSMQEAVLSNSKPSLGESEKMSKGRSSKKGKFLLKDLQNKLLSKIEMPDMQKCILTKINRNSFNLFKNMPSKIKKQAGYSEHDSRKKGAIQSFDVKNKSNGRSNKQEEGQFKQDWNAEPYEASRSSREDGRNYEETTSRETIQTFKATSQGWENSTRNRKISKQSRIFSGGVVQGIRSSGPPCWYGVILDRAMPFGYKTKSRFHSLDKEAKKNDSFRSAALASKREIGDSEKGLSRVWVDNSSTLVRGIKGKKQTDFNSKGIFKYWNRVKKITFLGRSLVFNFTVCPTHTYIASGLVLHNCPYKCTYCFNSNENWQEMVKGKNRLRYHSPEWMVEDIERTFHDYGGQLVSFQDDIFGIDLEWLEKFTRLYQRIRIPFFAQLRPRLITEDRVKLLKEAGIHIVSFAIESGNEQTRREFLDREEPNAIIEAGCKLLHKHKIKFRMQNMLGIPVKDPLGDALETLRFNIKMKPTLSWCSILQAYPGTAIAKKVVAMGMFKSEEDLMPLVNSTFFDEGSLPIKGKKKIERLQKYWSAVVRWPWLYWPVRFLININFGKKFHNWIFETTKGYVNKKEYWRIEHMEKHVAITSHQELDRLGGELVRNKQKEAAVC